MFETTLGIAMLAMSAILYPICRYFPENTKLKFVDFSQIIPKENKKWQW